MIPAATQTVLLRSLAAMEEFAGYSAPNNMPIATGGSSKIG